MSDHFDSPALGVGFLIDTGSSYDELLRLQSVMSSTEGKLIADAQRIEQATGNMVRLGGASAEIATFGNTATREMQSVARATATAEKSGEAMVRQLNRQIEVFGKTASEIRQMRAELRAAEAESRGLTELAGRIRMASTEMTRLEAPTAAMGRTGKLAGHHVQNLAFQFQDLGVQMAGAAGSSAPLKMAFMALMQQGAQIQGIMSQAQIGIGAVTKEFGRMVAAGARMVLLNPYVIGLTVAASGAFGAFKMLQSSIANTNNLDAYAKSVGLTKDEIAKLGSTALTMGDVFTGVWRTFDQITGISEKFSALREYVSGVFSDMVKAAANGLSLIVGGHVGAYDAIKATWRLLPSAMGDLFMQAVNATIRAMNDMINSAREGINWAIRSANMAITALGGASRISEIEKANPFSEKNNPWAGEAAKAGKAAVEAFQKGAARGMAGVNALGKQLYDNIAGANRDRVKSKIAEILEDRTEKSVGGAARSAKSAVDELARSLDSILGRFDPGKVAAREYAKTLAEIDKLLNAGMITSSDAISYRIEAMREAMDGDRKRLADQVSKGLGYTIGGADDPIERATKGMIAARDATRKFAFETKEAFDEEQARRFADQLARLPAILQEISPALGAMSGLLNGFSTGNFASVPGKAGAVLQLVNDSGALGDKGWKSVTDKLDSIFGQSGDGSFAKTMNKLMQGAGLGIGASSMILGAGGSKTGAGIGGALGQALGEKLLSSLGSFAGPLGSMVGGVLGGLVGGLFKKTSWGSASITGGGAGDISATGSSSSRSKGASALAGSVQDALNKVAEQLGGGVGSFNVSIGTYKDNFRVSTSGSSKMGGYSGSAAQNEAMYGLYDFGEDQGAAIAFALMDAIKDGAITGLRPGTAQLLKLGDDVEAQLSKALSFQGVFDDLRERLDPTGFALGKLDTSMEKLTKIFKEAGATAAEYAELEQLIALQRKDVLDEAAARDLDKLNERRSLEVRLLEAQGNAIGALALSREIEISQTDETLRALLQQVFAAEDAAGIGTEAANQLRDAWKSVGETIMDEVKRIRGLATTSGDAGFAALNGQFNAATALARSGDKDAADSLAGLSQSMLAAAATVATSRQELARVQAQTAASLEQTYAAISGFGASAAATDAAILAAASATSSANSASNDNGVFDLKAALEEMKAEIAGLRSDNNAGMAVVAGNTGAMKRHLDNVTAASGGDAIAIVTAA